MPNTNKPTQRMQEILERFDRLNPLPIEKLTPSLARQLPELKDAVAGVIHDHIGKRLLTGFVESVGSVEHVLIPGPNHTTMLGRIYRPDTEGPHPLLVYFHGGGFVIGNLNSYDSSCRALCNAANCLVLSVAYRQAPEHPFPAARDDAFSAYQWALTYGKTVGAIPGLVAVAGESAGGNLAALVCQMAKRHGLDLPIHQLLIYPWVDTNFENTSYTEFSDSKPLNREMMKWFLGHYSTAGLENEESLAFPMKAKNCYGLSPATIITAEIDPLRFEGEAYGIKLESFGVPVLAQRFKGVTHEFFGMGAVLDEAKEAVELAAKRLREAFEQSDEAGNLLAGVRAQERDRKGFDTFLSQGMDLTY